MGGRKSERTTAPHQHDVVPFVYQETAKKVAEVFDYRLPTVQTPPTPFDLKPLLSEPFGVGVLVGSSGSGKTQALIQAGYNPRLFDNITGDSWNRNLCILDHFSSTDEAIESLGAAGLNSVPQWFKPWHALSKGEQYRATLAKALSDAKLNSNILFVDEFTSVVDRTVARSLCESLNRHTLKHPRIVVATCHHDVLQWLRWDWAVDTDSQEVQHANTNRTTNHWRLFLDEKVGDLRRG